MARELTPEQTAALEDFEQKSQDATDAAQAARDLHTEAADMEHRIAVADQDALNKYAAALEAANTFRDALLPPAAPPAGGAAAPAKK